MSLPQVAMLLVGGAASDRFGSRPILIWADIARAVVVGGLAALTATGGLHLWELYVAAGTLGVAAAFAAPAFDAVVPRLVSEDELHQANAIEQFVRPATIQLAGPALGGLAVATVGSVGALSFDAATFVFSAVCMIRLVAPEPDTAPGEDGMVQDVRRGLRYVRRHTWLWGTFLSATLAYLLFVGPTQVLLPYIVRNTFEQNASAYGLVLAAGGVGALIGAVAMGRSREPRRPMTWIYLWWTVATLGVAGYGVFEQMWGLVMAALVINGAEAVGAVVWATTKQRRVPREMLGRVSSVDWLVSTALLPLSYAITPAVAHLLGARTTLVLAGTVGAAVTLSFLFLPGMRRDPDETSGAPRPGAGDTLVSVLADAADGGPVGHRSPLVP